MSRSLEAEIQRNYAAFLDMLGSLTKTHHGQFALIHNQQLAGIFDSPSEAARSGFAEFGETHYSIQQITDEPVDLGFMSNAIREGAAPK